MLRMRGGGRGERRSGSPPLLLLTSTQPPLTSSPPLASCQFTRLSECLVRLVTLESFLPFMISFMCCQDIRPGECLFHIGNNLRLSPLCGIFYVLSGDQTGRIPSHICHTFVTQASYLCDSFVCFHITLITHERFLSYLGIMYSLLPCAGSLMSCQGTRLCKCLVTLITLKGSSSVWVLLCFARYPQFVNALSHWSHLKTSLLYGFSYVMSGYQTL